MKPTQPALIPMPFAQNGNKNAIPENGTEGKGDASFSLGFPQITETPLSIGGLPPSRKDFNGIFNLLSMFAFFGQSGGKFAWSNKLNYAPPAVIYHNGVLWWCVKENGTDTVVKEPGTDNAYWVTLIEYLHQNAKTLGLKVGGGVPIGTIIIWGYTKNPSEDYGVWLDCDGRNVSNYPNLVAAIGSTTIPDYRGLFLRCQGAQTVDGTVHTSPAVGTKQGDAIRNIEGSFIVDDYVGDGGYNGEYPPNGAFKDVGTANYDAKSGLDPDGRLLSFNASYVVPTANENRPVNATVRFLIKADD